MECIYEINNSTVNAKMPILDAVYKILYERESAQRAIQSIFDELN